jgi:UDP-N-acetylmuramate dehydrogenase
VEIQSQVSLKDWTWWKIGGPAEYFCLPENMDQVREAVEFAHTKGLRITILGGGTNVLVSDQGIAGLVIDMKKLSGLEVKEQDERLHIVALAGTNKSELVKIFLQRRLAPALFLCGLPGDVGGGIVMNAGVSEMVVPHEFNELVEWIEVLPLQGDSRKVRRLRRDQVQWRYRSSDGWQPGILLRAGLSWPLTPDDNIPQLVKEATKNRLQKQPLNLPSCGSTFKNPEGFKAGALIDQVGLKGYQVGQAQVSPKHANFIVNLGGASAQDVRQIINHVQAEVLRRFSVQLETEVRFLGRW